MTEPPLELGAVQLTTDCVLTLEVALTAVGALGVFGVVAVTVCEDPDEPIEFAAVTVTA
jgi:hypothetical protein